MVASARARSASSVDSTGSAAGVGTLLLVVVPLVVVPLVVVPLVVVPLVVVPLVVVPLVVIVTILAAPVPTFAASTPRRGGVT